MSLFQVHYHQHSRKIRFGQSDHRYYELLIHLSLAVISKPVKCHSCEKTLVVTWGQSNWNDIVLVSSFPKVFKHLDQQRINRIKQLSAKDIADNPRTFLVSVFFLFLKPANQNLIQVSISFVHLTHGIRISCFGIQNMMISIGG